MVYLRIRRGWLGIQALTFTGRMTEWSGVPEVVFAKDLKGREKVYAPDDPKLFSAMEHRPFRAFDHPRVVMDGFENTGALVRALVRRLGVRKSVVPWVYIIHVQDEWEGGLADIERRSLIQMVREAGANRALLLTGNRDLTAPDLLRISQRKTVVDEVTLALDAANG